MDVKYSFLNDDKTYKIVHIDKNGERKRQAVIYVFLYPAKRVAEHYRALKAWRAANPDIEDEDEPIFYTDRHFKKTKPGTTLEWSPSTKYAMPHKLEPAEE